MRIDDVTTNEQALIINKQYSLLLELEYHCFFANICKKLIYDKSNKTDIWNLLILRPTWIEEMQKKIMI